MPDLLVRSFAPLLLAFQSCFTQPSFHSFWALSCAWILCSGRRSLTRIIQSAQLTEFKHYCSFHRFFSQACWDLDDLGHLSLCKLSGVKPCALFGVSTGEQPLDGGRVDFEKVGNVGCRLATF